MTKLTNNLKLRSSIRLLRYAASELRDVSLLVSEIEKDIQSAVSFAKKNLDHTHEKKPQETPDSHETDIIDTSQCDEHPRSKKNSRPDNEEKSHEKDEPEVEDSIEKLSIEPEYKKLYKKIAKKTHPDKVMNSRDMDQYEKEVFVSIFKDAKSALESSSRNLLLSTGCEVGVDILDLGFDKSDLSERLKKQLESINTQLGQVMSSHVWAWEDECSIDVKIQILRAYMGYSGINDLTDVFLRDVIESYSMGGRPKRKIGTRPKKIKRF